MLSIRLLRRVKSRVTIFQWSPPLAPGSTRRCYTRNWYENTIVLPQRTFITIATTPEEKIGDAEIRPCPNLEGSTELPMLEADKIDAASNSPTYSSSKRNRPRPPQSMVPLSQHVNAIIRDVEIGKLSDADIKAILTEAFERSKFNNRDVATTKDNIAYAEQLVHRLVQEVNYRHLKRIEVNENVKNETLQTSHAIRSLGIIWHYVILGSSRLPVITDRKSVV